MKLLLIYIGVIVWIWNGFPENYSTGEKALVLVPLSFPLVFYIIYKIVGYGPQPRREIMSYEPDVFDNSRAGGDCGSTDGGCEGGD